MARGERGGGRARGVGGALAAERGDRGRAAARRAARGRDGRGLGLADVGAALAGRALERSEDVREVHARVDRLLGAADARRTRSITVSCSRVTRITVPATTVPGLIALSATALAAALAFSADDDSSAPRFRLAARARRRPRAAR